MGRAANLAAIYKLKSNYLSSSGGCSSAPLLPISLENYMNTASLISNSQELAQLNDEMEDLRTKNGNLACRLF